MNVILDRNLNDNKTKIESIDSALIQVNKDIEQAQTIFNGAGNPPESIERTGLATEIRE